MTSHGARILGNHIRSTQQELSGSDFATGTLSILHKCQIELMFEESRLLATEAYTAIAGPFTEQLRLGLKQSPLLGDRIHVFVPLCLIKVAGNWLAQVVLGGKLVQAPAVAIFTGRARYSLVRDVDQCRLFVHDEYVAMQTFNVGRGGKRLFRNRKHSRVSL